ncbi:MAG: SRPBCC domain-containing protein [Gammaproteobacteria bacterium]
MRRLHLLLLPLLVLLPGVVNALPEAHASMLINAPIDKVWHSWTTAEGLKSFLAPDNNIDVRVGGRFDIYFAPEREPGQRGTENMRLLILEPNNRLVFTFDQPTFFPEVRGQHTWVTVTLRVRNENQTDVYITHAGLGDHGQWIGVHTYFTNAWQIILGRLEWTMHNGPVDWKNPPSGLWYAPDIEELLKLKKSI